MLKKSRLAGLTANSSDSPTFTLHLPVSSIKATSTPSLPLCCGAPTSPWIRARLPDTRCCMVVDAGVAQARACLKWGNGNSRFAGLLAEAHIYVMPSCASKAYKCSASTECKAAASRHQGRGHPAKVLTRDKTQQKHFPNRFPVSLYQRLETRTPQCPHSQIGSSYRTLGGLCYFVRRLLHSAI